MDKKTFELPVLEIETIEAADIITASNGDNEGGWDSGWTRH